MREPVNSITHLFGAVAALIVTVVLLFVAGGGALTYLALSVFGLSSVLLFTASTLLHAIHAGPVAANMLRRFDHAAIFVLIAGTYTPVLLLALLPGSPRLAWWLLAVVWLIALAGVVFKLYWINAPRWLSTGLYLGMGWLVVLAILPITRALSATIRAVGPKAATARPAEATSSENWHMRIAPKRRMKPGLATAESMPKP